MKLRTTKEQRTKLTTAILWTGNVSDFVADINDLLDALVTEKREHASTAEEVEMNYDAAFIARLNAEADELEKQR